MIDQPKPPLDRVELLRRRVAAKARRRRRQRTAGALALFLGVAGTYLKNDSVDLVYTRGGSRAVVTLRPVADEPS